MSSFNFNFNFGNQQTSPEDFIKTARWKPQPCCFDNARRLAKEIDIAGDYYFVVSGSFIFGDMIEALCLENNLEPDSIYITTLGLSHDNIDSIVNLHDYFAKQINLIVSKYYVSMELKRDGVSYMAQEFAGKNIRVGCCASHAKICLISNGEDKITIFGSANLSSSSNLETFALTHDKEVYEFNKKILDGILDDFEIINGATGVCKFSHLKGNCGDTMYRKVEKYAQTADNPTMG